ncbi:MAG: CoA-binding protein [Acidimicrobiia bacterium]|nr:CoA-binding protein [Acidimicrobiia bacterium]
MTLRSDDVIARLDRSDPLIAVVGATDDPSKYGHRIYRNLKNKGYRVVGVNPTRTTIDGDPAYASVGDLPEPPDIVNVVIPPARTLEVINGIAALPDPAIWIQPGAADPAVREAVVATGMPAVIDDCIMVLTKTRS